VSRIDPLSTVPSSEEAVLVAERLSVLLEARRAGSSRADTGAIDGDVIGARHSGRLLGNLLLTRAYIVESELDYALQRQASTGGALGEILVDLGLITERDLVHLLAEQLRMEVVDPARIEGDPAILALLPGSDARQRAALPWRRIDEHIDVAMADPTDGDAVAELMRLLGGPLRLYLAPRADIEAAVDRLYERRDS
jgi:Type II secretion system (T2SS), protein E, N-terminal domain